MISSLTKYLKTPVASFLAGSAIGALSTYYYIKYSRSSHDQSLYSNPSPLNTTSYSDNTNTNDNMYNDNTNGMYNDNMYNDNASNTKIVPDKVERRSTNPSGKIIIV